MSKTSVMTRRRSLSLLTAACALVAAPAALAQNRRTHERQKKIMRNVQRMLRDVGYDPGPIDGSNGGQTASAISKFQRDKGLKQTGTLTAPTLQALSSTAQRRSPTRIRRRR